jgi:enamine deaminase RidA (YjgF/YER057c/UK114 family)
MKNQSRRDLLKGAAKSVAVVGGVAVMGKSAAAAAPEKAEKKSYSANAANASGKAPLFSSAVSYGNLLFLAGVGAHFQGTIEEHTRHVLQELEKNLVAAGSSLEKVLKVNVYLNDLKDYAAMNSVYAETKWGSIPPVRTTVAPAAGIPGNSLVEIDCIAYI